jgi:hypothetical protein
VIPAESGFDEDDRDEQCEDLGNSGSVADPISLGFERKRNATMVSSVQPAEQFQMTLVTAQGWANLIAQEGPP